MSDADAIGPERLWGAPSIARAIGCSPDYVRSLAARPGVPIYRPPGTDKFFAFRSELRAWLRTKPTAADSNQRQPSGQIKRRPRKP